MTSLLGADFWAELHIQPRPQLEEKSHETLPCRDLLLWEVGKHARGLGAEAQACTPVIDLQPQFQLSKVLSLLIPTCCPALPWGCLAGFRERGRPLYPFFTWMP